MLIVLVEMTGVPVDNIDDYDDIYDDDSTDSKMWQDSLPHKKMHQKGYICSTVQQKIHFREAICLVRGVSAARHASKRSLITRVREKLVHGFLFLTVWKTSFPTEKSLPNKLVNRSSFLYMMLLVVAFFSARRHRVFPIFSQFSCQKKNFWEKKRCFFIL